MRRTFLILMSVFTVASLTPACSDDAAESGTKAKKKDKGSEEKKSDDDDDDDSAKPSKPGATGSTGKTTTNTDCSASSGTGATPASGDSGSTGSTGATGSTGSTGDEGDGAGLSLAEGPAYDTISTIIDTKCVSCHVKKFSSGDFTTVDGVKAKADLILERMSLETDDPKFMPPGGSAFEADELKRVADWIKGGKQGAGKPVGGDSPTDTSGTGTSTSGCGSTTSSGGTTAGSTTTTGDGGGTTGDDAGTGTDTTSDDTPPDDEPGSGGDEAVQTVLNPAKKGECNSANKPFDRSLENGKGGCADGIALVKEFACTKEGVMGFYGNSDQVKTQVFDVMEAAGKKLEDCGKGPSKTGVESIVLYFFCLSDTGGKDPPNCKDPSTLGGKTFYPKTSAVFVPTP